MSKKRTRRGIDRAGSQAKASTTKADEGATRDEGGSRTRHFKLAIVLLSVGLFLVLDLVAGILVDGDTQRSFRQPHPYYHHGLRPNQNRLTHWGGHRYRMITNSLGFRDKETRAISLASESPRVLLIGDSTIEGLGVAYDQTVAGQLARVWEPDGVEVLNAGVVSYSPHLYYLRTRYLIEQRQLDFDHLIVFIDISDIQDETFYQDFQPGSDGFRQPGWWQQNSLLARAIARLTSPQPRTNNEFRTDADVNVWMEATDAYQSGGDPEIGRWEWTIREPLYEQWGRRGLQLAGQHMRKLVDLCRDHEIDLTVVIYPSPVQIFAGDQDSRQVRFWQQFCREQKVTLVNLWPLFFDGSGPAEIYQQLYLFSDMHWNATGSRLVAEQIDQAVGSRISGAGK